MAAPDKLGKSDRRTDPEVIRRERAISSSWLDLRFFELGSKISKLCFPPGNVLSENQTPDRSPERKNPKMANPTKIPMAIERPIGICRWYETWKYCANVAHHAKYVNITMIAGLREFINPSSCGFVLSFSVSSAYILHSLSMTSLLL